MNSTQPMYSRSQCTADESKEQRDFSKTSFYSPRNKLSFAPIQARLCRQEKVIKDAPVPSQYHQRLLDPVGHWRVFHRQQDAFDFARSNSEDLHVFAYESETFTEQQGQRLYLVASYEHFWHYYSQMSTSRRHHYEVIPHGAVCHLYFDLEFGKLFNPDADGVAMTTIFIKYVCVWLQHLYGVRCQGRNILQLDASTALKFSRHLIFHLPSVVFQNNIHAGGFVKHICNELLRIISGHPLPHNQEASNDQNIAPDLTTEPPAKVARNDPCVPMDKKERSPVKVVQQWPHKPGSVGDVHLDVEELAQIGLTRKDLAMLVVNNKSDEEVLFCDTGVYTKNRNFRIYLSCKLGKQNPLLVAKENQYQPRKVCQGRHLNTLAELKTDGDAQIFVDSLVSNISFIPTLRVLTFEGDTSATSRLRGPGSDMQPRNDPAAALAGCQQSPYPEIDDHISSLLTWGGVQGCIRRWSYFCQGELLIYDIARNRWCHNIGRAHHSNNILLVVDLKKGVYYQKCHDPVCRAANYKSQEWPVPASVLPASFFEDADEADLDDDELLEAVSQVEKSVNQKVDENKDNPDSQSRSGTPSTNEGHSNGHRVPGLDRSDLRQSQHTCVPVATESCDADGLDDDDLLSAVTELETSITEKH